MKTMTEFYYKNIRANLRREGSTPSDCNETFVATTFLSFFKNINEKKTHPTNFHIMNS